eukprot:MONOS_12174.1-p1 / transcript=MONOS_12174.1 / gene=MONOS_12174 / organism=Monocercomonoides_exilis_PA203 / gene_product=GG23321 / transcript_product=GG23321 / location=Mono_scaffold00656:2625-4413(+) / protein_length=383 / sequence_SO=supercontig / SO=protein_coding / is_pseudo=false
MTEKPKLDDLREFFNFVITQETPQVAWHVIDALAGTMRILPDEIQKQIGILVIDETNKKQSNLFDAPLYKIRECLAEQYEKSEEYELGADLLKENLKTSHEQEEMDQVRLFVKLTKMSLFTKELQTLKSISQDELLKLEMFTVAQEAFKRASPLRGKISDKELLTELKICDALISEYSQTFQNAAEKYYPLSITIPSICGRDTLLSAISCTLLAPPSEQRARLISSLNNDERVKKLPVYHVINKIFLNRLVTSDEDKHLMETAMSPFHMPFLERAILQHNIVSSSLLYDNITIDQLGALLKVDAVKAEKETAKLICDGVIKGTISQIGGMIHFKDESAALSEWDRDIAQLCHGINGIYETLKREGMITSAGKARSGKEEKAKK